MSSLLSLSLLSSLTTLQNNEFLARTLIADREGQSFRGLFREVLHGSSPATQTALLRQSLREYLASVEAVCFRPEAAERAVLLHRDKESLQRARRTLELRHEAQRALEIEAEEDRCFGEQRRAESAARTRLWLVRVHRDVRSSELERRQAWETTRAQHMETPEMHLEDCLAHFSEHMLRISEPLLTSESRARDALTEREAMEFEMSICSNAADDFSAVQTVLSVQGDQWRDARRYLELDEHAARVDIEHDERDVTHRHHSTFVTTRDLIAHYDRENQLAVGKFLRLEGSARARVAEDCFQNVLLNCENHAQVVYLHCIRFEEYFIFTSSILFNKYVDAMRQIFNASGRGFVVRLQQQQSLLRASLSYEEVERRKILLERLNVPIESPGYG
eukprot:PhM_4_TR14937/c0_g1_i1/m.10787